jgi:hypothetical protein
LYAVELSGAGGYAAGKPLHRKERSLSATEWAEVTGLVDESDFWLLSTTVENFGLDGAHWLLEISEPNRYHIVDRWSGGELEPLGRRLLAISGLEPEPIY